MFSAGIPDPSYVESSLANAHPQCHLPLNAEEVMILNTVTSTAIPSSVYVDQDVNTLLNKRFEEIGSKRRCFFWSTDRQKGFLCGPAIIDTVEVPRRPELQIFHFCGRDRGVWPEEMISHFDRRRTIALFFEPVQEELKIGEAPALSRFEWGAVRFFLDRHEIAHSRESYVAARFMEVAAKSWGWENEAGFDCGVREILADLGALRKETEHYAQSKEVKHEDLVRVYGWLRGKPRKARERCIQMRDQFAEKLKTRFVGKSSINNADFIRFIDNEIARYEQYLRGLESLLEKISRPYVVASQEVQNDPNFAKLGKFVQYERVADAIVAMIIKNGKKKPEKGLTPYDELRAFFQTEMRRLALK